MKIQRCRFCGFVIPRDEECPMLLASDHTANHVEEVASQLVDDIALFSAVVPEQIRARAKILRELLDGTQGFTFEEVP